MAMYDEVCVECSAAMKKITMDKHGPINIGARDCIAVKFMPRTLVSLIKAQNPIHSSLT